MAYTLLLLFAASVIIIQVNGIDYCQICIDHTLCLFNSTSSVCNRVIRTGITDAEIATILDAHNKYRQTVARGNETRGNPGPQPPAANMRVVSWDSELAAIAQMWVRQCLFLNDLCRNTNGTYVGQNLFENSTTSTGSTADWKSAVKAWYEEVPDFDRRNVSPFSSISAGHYSQVVWASTVKVGCGYINYFDGIFYIHYYACNYSPGGNIILGEMYKVGTACSACPRDCNTQYDGLCNK